MHEEKIHFGQDNGKEYMQFAMVGVTFDNKQKILSDLFKESIKNKNMDCSVKLQEQKDNPYDENAIKIISLYNGETIGYVSKEINQDIKKLLPQIKKSYINQIYFNNKRFYNAMIRLEF